MKSYSHNKKTRSRNATKLVFITVIQWLINSTEAIVQETRTGKSQNSNTSSLSRETNKEAEQAFYVWSSHRHHESRHQETRSISYIYKRIANHQPSRRRCRPKRPQLLGHPVIKVSAPDCANRTPHTIAFTIRTTKSEVQNTRSTKNR